MELLKIYSSWKSLTIIFFMLMKENKARKGPVIAIGVEGDKELESIVDDFVSVPKIENKDFYALPMLVL